LHSQARAARFLLRRWSKREELSNRGEDNLKECGCFGAKALSHNPRARREDGWARGEQTTVQTEMKWAKKTDSGREGRMEAEESRETTGAYGGRGSDGRQRDIWSKLELTEPEPEP